MRRMSDEAQSWDDAYAREAPPPWDIGRPQPVVQRLADEGLLAGDLLDAGCGTGEHALLAAAGGARVLGVDLSRRAIERARAKASERGLEGRFVAGDMLTYPVPAESFDVVIDSGVFHSFEDDERPTYAAQLRRALREGGRLYLICFSDRQPGDWGPRRITRGELEQSFSAGWAIARIEPVVFDINPLPEATEVQAWLLEAQAV